MPQSVGRANQAEGAKFEAYFAHYARLSSMLCVQNGVRVKHLRGGRVQCMPSNLDWMLVNTGGHVAMLDTKSWDRTSFGLSLINKRQLELALAYEKHGLRSGFVVCLRRAAAVVYYPASIFAKAASRTSYGVEQGTLLGQPARFDLRPIFLPRPSSPQRAVPVASLPRG